MHVPIQHTHAIEVILLPLLAVREYLLFLVADEVEGTVAIEGDNEMKFAVGGRLHSLTGQTKNFSVPDTPITGCQLLIVKILSNSKKRGDVGAKTTYYFVYLVDLVCLVCLDY